MGSHSRAVGEESRKAVAARSVVAMSLSGEGRSSSSNWEQGVIRKRGTPLSRSAGSRPG